MKTFILISILFVSCQSRKGLRQEVQQRINTHKEFIKSFSFDGVISKGIYCENCQFNKYQLVINLNSLTPKTIRIDNKSFQPYYFFDGKSQLTISVVKDIYDAVHQGDVIEKRSNTNYVIIKGNTYKIISDQKYKWLPD
ncbi:hypothetical protein ACFQZI_19855 [Mucilaginibacter lutimaris]|uniref:NlpE N-terminal domain-containing protein n=1 Tax=Mucilaginibacter lutimaris TaxID=931629 RepID=A0ABW2ZMA7_9SPHI